MTRLPLAIEEWREPASPRNSAQAARRRGGLFQRHFLKVLKGNLDALPRRTQALHGLMDTACQLIVTVKPL